MDWNRLLMALCVCALIYLVATIIIGVLSLSTIGIINIK